MITNHVFILNPVINKNFPQKPGTTRPCFGAQQKDEVCLTCQKEPSLEKKFKNALEIAKTLNHNEIHHMKKADQNRLEGLQYGLKTFEGLTFPEIYFLLSKSRSLIFPLYRDCAGKCGPCFLNGQPAQRNNPNLVRRVDFEDFKNFTEDFKELTTRLGFDYARTCKNNKNSEEPVSNLFHDSDSKDTWLVDKNGKVYNFPELNKMMYDATGMKGLFDTAGWAPRNVVTQKRMEAFADYYSNPEHFDEISHINISLNTYHGLLLDANKKKAQGDMEGFLRQRNNYAKNIANAMYTMTPLLITDKYTVFRKCVSDNESKKFDDYKSDALQEIQTEVLKELEKRYEEDLKNGVTKFVKTKDQIQRLLNLHKSCFSDIKKRILPNENNELFSKLTTPVINLIRDYEDADFNDVTYFPKTLLIDMNGKVYYSNALETFETDVQLNFKNKNKDSKKLYPKPDRRILRIKDEKFE